MLSRTREHLWRVQTALRSEGNWILVACAPVLDWKGCYSGRPSGVGRTVFICDIVYVSKGSYKAGNYQHEPAFDVYQVLAIYEEQSNGKRGLADTWVLSGANRCYVQDPEEKDFYSICSFLRSCVLYTKSFTKSEHSIRRITGGYGYFW